jgi:hypothetical protein
MGWVSDCVPVTNAVSVNTPFTTSRLGLGVSVINDKIGPTHEIPFLPIYPTLSQPLKS